MSLRPWRGFRLLPRRAAAQLRPLPVATDPALAHGLGQRGAGRRSLWSTSRREPNRACPEVGHALARVGARLCPVWRLEPVARRHLDAAPLVERRVLDEGDEAAGHEAPGAHDLPGPRHLPHLHDAARRDHLDPAARARGDDLERLDALPGVDHGLDSVTLHGANDTPGRIQLGPRPARCVCSCVRSTPVRAAG